MPRYKDARRGDILRGIYREGGGDGDLGDRYFFVEERVGLSPRDEEAR